MDTHPDGAAPFGVPEEDDEDEDDFLEDDDWEDQSAIADLQAKHEGWYITKLNRYTPRILADIEEWCSTNCRGEWKKAGWHSGCSYTVALCFAEKSDAVFYRLRWSTTV